jgi:enoyl-CoA hydratase
VNAEIYSPEGAVEAGFLDEVVAQDKLVERATELAQHFKTLNMRAHRETKVKAKADYLALLDRCIEQDAEHLGLNG